MPGADLEDVSALVRRGQVVSFNTVAALSFFVWDILITFDDEITFIWRKSNTDPMKWLFFILRYYILSVQIALMIWTVSGVQGTVWTQQECRAWFILLVTSIPTVITFVQAVLTLRVCALYNGPHMRRLRLFLAGYWAITVILVFAILLARFLATPISTLCPLMGPPRMTIPLKGGAVTLALVSAFPLSFEATLLALTTRKFLTALREGWGRTPILELLMRDGTWAFVLTFVGTAINLTDSLIFTPISGSTFPWTAAIFSFSATRIILNTCRLAPKSRGHLTTEILSERTEGVSDSVFFYRGRSTRAHDNPTFGSAYGAHTLGSGTAMSHDEAHPMKVLPKSSDPSSRTSTSTARSPTSTRFLISEPPGRDSESWLPELDWPTPRI